MIPRCCSCAVSLNWRLPRHNHWLCRIVLYFSDEQTLTKNPSVTRKTVFSHSCQAPPPCGDVEVPAWNFKTTTDRNNVKSNQVKLSLMKLPDGFHHSTCFLSLELPDFVPECPNIPSAQRVDCFPDSGASKVRLFFFLFSVFSAHWESQVLPKGFCRVVERESSSRRRILLCRLIDLRPLHQIGCEQRGCCWSPLDERNTPWCFFPKNHGYTVESVENPYYNSESRRPLCPLFDSSHSSVVFLSFKLGREKRKSKAFFFCI